MRVLGTMSSPAVLLAAAFLSLPSSAADELFVCGWNSSNVIRCDEEGTCGTFVPTASGSLRNAHSLEFGSDGHLYVSSWGNGMILRYDGGTGAFIDRFVTGAGNPTDAIFGPDGHLYVTDFACDCVLRFDGQTGAFIDQFVTSGDGGLLNPESLKFGPDGDLYVLSGTNANVLRFNGSTGDLRDVFIPSGSGGMIDPHFLFFHDDGLLYITAFGNSKVLRFDAATGDFFDVFVEDDPKTKEDESGGLSSAHGAAFGPDGNLYVASFGNHRVIRYAPDGTFLDVFIPSGSGVTGPIDVVFRNTCPADIDGSGAVDFADVLAILAAWGNAGGPEDLDGSGTVDFGDILAVLAAWGPCP